MTESDGITITSTTQVGIRKPMLLSWRPQPDITTYELAQAVPLFSADIMWRSDMYEALPENVRRHFEVVG